jgi:hypothetical protein
MNSRARIIYDMAEEAYFTHPALSASELKLILRCPAKYIHSASNPTPPRPVFDKGKAAHTLVLGVGAPLVEVDAADWRTNAAKSQRDQIYKDGGIPLLPKDMRIVQEMAGELHEHPVASELMSSGRPEVTIIWQDGPSEQMRRARLDWLRNDAIVDYKSTASADLDSIVRSTFKYNYHQQGASYEDAVLAAEISNIDLPYFLIWQEKVAPYVVTVTELAPEVILEGRRQNRRAIEKYLQCTATGRWPGYSDTVETIYLPDHYESWTDLDEEDE